MRISKICIAVLAAVTEAHMEINYPPPLRSKFNSIALAAAPGSIDYSMTSPLNGDGSNFPCKGYHSDLGTPAGASVVSWAAGANVNFTITGGAFHNGGSCQISLSFDKGVSFQVIHSFEGACPTASGGSFDVTIPSDSPTGEALFAWTWLNNVGNREYYMNCAVVTITGATAKRDTANPYSARPGLFVANLGNGCTTTEGTDVEFPNGGNPCTHNSQKSAPPVGICKAVKGIGGDSASSSGSSSSGSSSAAAPLSSSSEIASQSSPASVATTSATSTPNGFITSYTSASTSVAVAPSSPATSSNSTMLPNTSSEGACTGSFNCFGSPSGPCCSQYGWCGVTSAHCDISRGCDPTKGTCGMNSTSPSGGASSSSGAISSPSASASASASSPAASSPNVVTETIMSISTVTVTYGARDSSTVPTGGVTITALHAASSSLAYAV